jgi:aconitate decarboxylase
MRALYSKISVQIINDPDPEDPAFSRFDTVEMTLKDGQVLKSGKIYYPRGHAHRPLTEADLKTKVLDCLTIWKAQADVASLASYPIESLYEKLAGLKQCSNVRQLFRH